MSHLFLLYSPPPCVHYPNAYLSHFWPVNSWNGFFSLSWRMVAFSLRIERHIIFRATLTILYQRKFEHFLYSFNWFTPLAYNYSNYCSITRANSSTPITGVVLFSSPDPLLHWPSEWGVSEYLLRDPPLLLRWQMGIKPKEGDHDRDGQLKPGQRMLSDWWDDSVAYQR